MSRPARWTAVLLLGVVFAVGALAGMAAEEAFGIDWFEFLDEETNREARLLSDLDLTGGQRDRVEEILEVREDRLEEYWEARLPEIRAIMDRSYAEIRAELTPEQRPAFDRRVRELGDGAAEEAVD